jgi:hypothetical protein
MLRKIIFFLLLSGVTAGLVGLFLYNKKMPSMATEQSELSVGAYQMFDEYSTDEAAATAKYSGKVVAVTGQVRQSSTLEDGTPKVILETGKEFGVLCEFDPNTKHTRTTFQPGEIVTIKGECAGLNFDVQLSRCVVVK